MLKTALCVIIAVTVTLALPWPWVPYPTPEEAPVQNGARITYGDNYIWGIFPKDNPLETHWAQFGPLKDEDGDDYLDPEWTLGSGTLPYLSNTSATFNWVENEEALFVIAFSTYARMYEYDVSSNQWVEHPSPSSAFPVTAGTCIAFVPNGDYDPETYRVPGWIYCLPGYHFDDRELWRYSIESSLPYVAIAGIFPPQGSIIADQTPMFQWDDDSTAIQYRLQVSTEPTFRECVVDTVIPVSEYQTTSELANGTYYWHTGTPNGLGWLWSSTHDFELQGGWEELEPIPADVYEGAAMVYEGHNYLWGEPRLFALVGGGSKESYSYSVEDDIWYSEEDAPVEVINGTSMTSDDPIQDWTGGPTAAFGGSGTSDYPYGYDPRVPGWSIADPPPIDPFPQPLCPGASFVQGPKPWVYLTTGGGRYFYRADPEKGNHGRGKGQQAGDTYAGSVRAQVIARYDDVEVEYQLPTSARVRATLHDAVGRQVGVLDAGEQQPGIHRLSWNRDGEGRKLSAGAYFVLLDMGTEQASLKTVVR